MNAIRQLSDRQINLIAFTTCVVAMLFAVGFLQHFLMLEPCPLCVLTRIIVISLSLVFLVALVHNPARLGQRLYAALATLIGLVGLGVQLRHIWLQNLPPDQVPACGPGLEFLLETQPVFSALAMVLKGSGDCAEIDWVFLGLTIPMQTALLFVFLLSLALWQLFRKTPQ